MKPTTCKLGLLTLDDACQTRATARLDDDHVSALADAYQAGEPIPPIAVVELPDGELVVVDGYHRWAALAIVAKRKPRTPVLGAVPVIVLAKGDRETASFHALGANAAHGIRRTPADKRHAIKLALAHPRCQKMAVAHIAQHLGVSVDLVAEVRAEVLGATSAKAEATEKAAKAAAAEVDRREKGAEPKSARAVAAEAGVSDRAIRRAIEGAAITGDPQQPHPVPPHYAALLAALDVLERETRAARKSLSTGDAQAFDDLRKRMVYIVRYAAKQEGHDL